MCDPVTMGIVAGAASGGAAYAVGGTTIAGMTVGSVSLMQAATIGLTVGSTVIQMGSQYQSAKSEQAKYRNQEIRYAQEEKERQLKQKSDENIRKTNYMSQLSSNLAIMGASGIEIGSKSFSNILLQDRETYKRDLDAIGLSGLEEKLSLLSSRKEAKIAHDSIDPTAKMVATGLTGLAKTTEYWGEKTGDPGTNKTKIPTKTKSKQYHVGKDKPNLAYRRLQNLYKYD